MPFGLGAAISGIGGLFGLVNGVGQILKSNRMNPVRPTYEIPEETKEALGLRQSLLNAGLPGEQLARQGIFTNQANAVSGLQRAASDQGQLLAGLNAAQGQTNNALEGLQQAREANYANNVAGLEGAQARMAAARDKAFEYNEYEPYLMQLQQKYQLKNAGNQSISNGIGALSTIGAVTAGMARPGLNTPFTGDYLGGQFGLNTPGLAGSLPAYLPLMPKV